jgi:acetyl esterase/lipase
MSKPHLTLVVAFLACQFLAPTVARAGDFEVEQGIAFCQAGQVELKLDLAYPVGGKGPYPALIYIFGSGWGYWPASRTECQLDIMKAAERGYVAIAIDYRQTNIKEGGQVKYRFPDQLHDAKGAVRWLRANAEKYHVDPEHIGVAGYSSGGHIALMLGLTRPSDGLEGSCGDTDYSSSVQAVVSSAGPTELKSQYNTDPDEAAAIEALIGGNPQQMALEYEKASPVSYVYRNSPPILTIHGDLDKDVPIEQAFLLDRRMKELVASHTLIIRKNAGHNDFTAEPEAFEFFDTYLKQKH